MTKDDLISRQAAIDRLTEYGNGRAVYIAVEEAVRRIEQLPPAQPERKAEELMPDGTLHLFTDTDLSKVNRVLVSQNGTHYGDLYYADDDFQNCGADMRDAERAKE